MLKPLSVCSRAGGLLNVMGAGRNRWIPSTPNVAMTGLVRVTLDSIPTMTNAQKLSLPANTAVGKKVKVSDGTPPNVIQELAAPSSTQGGVFVSGGTQDGVYLKGVDTENGRDVYGILGGDYTSDYFLIRWNNFSSNPTSGVNNGFGWRVVNFDDGLLDYYSLSDVATPDLASNWKNASDDSPASITVSSVSVGQIAAGIIYGGNFYAVTTPVNGRNAYHDVLGVAPDFTFNGTIWTDGTHNGTGTPAFPWDVTGITITRDDVASEANWSVVP